MKKILVLGAGVYQLPLIKKIKERGDYCIVVSWNGNYPGFEYADKIYYEDTTNEEKVLEIAKLENINAAVTTGTDVPMKTLGRINDELGLFGVSYSAASLATNKLEMKTAFEKNGVRSARFRKVSNLMDVKLVFEELNLPLVFKAVDSSGSRGIIKVENYCDVENAFNEVFSVTKEKYFIIEEYVEGKEFGAQALVFNGKLLFLLPHDDELFYGKNIVPIGHSAPMDIPNELYDDIYRQVELAISSLNLDNCALNIDFIVKNNETYILEIGARAGATCLVELVSISYGIDYYSKIIDVALGKDPSFKINSNIIPNASIVLYSDKSGRITSIKDNNQSDKNIFDIHYDYSLGDYVQKFKVGPDRIGHIIVTGATLKDAKANLMRVRKNIEIDVEEVVLR